MNSNSNEIARFRKLNSCSDRTSCDTLLVDCTPRMTELAAGRVYTATPCTQLVYYTERLTDQITFRALLICGYTMCMHGYHAYTTIPCSPVY